MHKLLARQLRRTLGMEGSIPETLRPLLELVDRAYHEADEERALLAHSMETVSAEMSERLVQLKRTWERSERMQAELRDSLALLNATLESTTDGIIVTDVSGAVLRWNQRGAIIWDLPAGASERRIGLFDLLEGHLGDAEVLRSRIATLAAAPTDESFDVLQTNAGSTIEAYSLPQRIGDAIVGRVWSFRDVSAREVLEGRLRHSQRIEAVGLLAGGIAHDFNNLLTVIGASAAFLEESVPADSQELADVKEISNAYERAARLTSQLLSFSRRQTLHSHRVDVARVVLGLQPMLARLIGEDITLDAQVDTVSGRVLHDEGQLEQVVVNLVVNARDAMPNGGHIRIVVAEVEIRDARVRVLDGLLLPGTYIRLDVADNGSGIPPEILGQIFDPFFTTKQPGRGTGLGLATVHGIVRQGGGHLAVATSVAVGTTFSVYLPVIASADDALSAASAPPTEMVGTETVLIAEDDPRVRLLMQRVLQHHGYRVLVARDGAEAMLCAAMHDGPIDLLVTDLVMPGVRGFELAKALQALRPGLRVLFISGYPAEELDRRGHDPEQGALLPKPFTPRQLAQAARMALHNSQET